MQDTAVYLLEKYNADLVYTQSDEISLVWKNEYIPPKMLFGSKVSKLNSLLASSATAFFNKNLHRIPEKEHMMPEFDSRIWTVPNLEVAAETIMWREMDATRNSISMAAQSVFSHKELQFVGKGKMLRMLEERGVVWGQYPDYFKKGTFYNKQHVNKKFNTFELSKLPPKHAAHQNPDLMICRAVTQKLKIEPLTKCANIVETLFGAK